MSADAKAPFDKVIDGVMSHMTSGGFATGKAVNTEAVDLAPQTHVCGAHMVAPRPQ